MKFKVGDRVRFKGKENIYKHKREYGIRFGWYSDMDCLCGKVFKITDIYGDSIEGHNSDWSVSEDMLEHCGCKRIN